MPNPPPSVPTAYVAIKVQHPNVSQMIQRDLQIISFFAHFISFFPGMQWLSLPEEAEVFGRMMNEQLDLRNEVKNLIKFEENFASRKAAVTFPRPLKDYSTRDILIEEYENALPLKAFLKHGGGPFDDVIAESGLDAFLVRSRLLDILLALILVVQQMLLLDNFVHSDLHPGNIMIKFYKPTTSFVLRGIIASILNTHPPTDPSHSTSQHEAQDMIVDRLRPMISDPESWRAELRSLSKQGYQPELVFIDTGLVTTLDGDNRRNFLDLFRAVAEFDGYRAGKLMVERCRSPELVVDAETFALKIQHQVLSVKSKTFSLARIKISDILTDVLKAVRQHHVKMEGDFINTVISVLLLEGIGRQLDPDLDLFKSSLPILRQLGRQMSAQENVKDLPYSNFGAMLKAREIEFNYTRV
jgi:aarF domain-containing kinase